MRYIDKSKRCVEFDEYLNHNTLFDWNELQTHLKIRLHQHLWREQQGLCIYCQQGVPEKTGTEYHIKSHIEHIRPRKKYPASTFKYDNLSVSCEGFDCKTEDRKKEFCEHRKGDEYNEDKFLNPTEIIEIEEYFIYDIEGGIYPNSLKNQNDKEKAEYMISILDLNHKILKNMRKEQYQTIVESEINGENIKDILNPNYETLESFYSMLKQLFL